MKKLRLWLFAFILLPMNVVALHGQPIRLGGEMVELEANVSSPTRGKGSLDLGQAVAGKQSAILQFQSQPSLADRSALAARGVKLEGYVGSNAYYVSVPKGTQPQALRGANVRAVAPLKADWRLAQSLREGRIPSYAKAANGQIKAIALYFSHATATEVEAAARRGGVRVVKSTPRLRAIEIEGTISQLRQLAGEPWCVQITPTPPPSKVSNFDAARLSRANILNQPKELGGRGLTGQGVRVGLWDANVDYHPDYEDRVKVLEYELSIRQTDGHGMHTGGTIVGAGIVDPLGKGIAPEAKLWAHNFNVNSNGLTESEEMLDMHDYHGISLTNNSYGSPIQLYCENGLIPNYSSEGSALIDMMCTYVPTMSHFHSSGNDRFVCGEYSSSTKRAKNIITVGAVDALGKISDFSSCGPADDGRLIPTIVAKGVQVYSTLPNNSYAPMDGTSMSCPATTGIAALLTERYHQLHSNADIPSALMKGILANSADEAGRPGPDYQYGYGIVNASNALRIIENRWWDEGTLRVNEANKTITVQVPDGTRQARVMLVWLDPPALRPFETGDCPLINNLDLTVNNTKPWVLNPDNVEENAQPGIDNINNLEQVTINNPSGTLTVTISGADKINSEDGEQKYYVVWYFDNQPATLTAPLGGEIFAPGERFMVAVSHEDFAKEGYTVEISYDGGGNYLELAKGDQRQMRILLPLDAPSSSQCKIRVRNAQGKELATSIPFTVAPVVRKLTLKAGNCGDPWALSWEKIEGATYNVLFYDGIKMAWETLASKISDNSFEVGPEKMRIGTSVFAVEVVKDDVKGRRSVGAVPTTKVPFALSETATSPNSLQLPWRELFMNPPLRTTHVEKGEKIVFGFYDTPASAGLPQGSRNLQAMVTASLDESIELFTPGSEQHTLKASTCQIQLPQNSGVKKLVLRASHVFSGQSDAKWSALRLTANGAVVPTFGGDELVYPNNGLEETAWDLTAYAGQSVSLSLEWCARLEGDALTLLYYEISQEKIPTEAKVSILACDHPRTGANLGTTPVKVTLANNGQTEATNVSLLLTCNGKIRGAMAIPSIKPLSQTTVTLKADLSAENPMGEEQTLEVTARYQHQGSTQNDSYRGTIRNLGEVIPHPDYIADGASLIAPYTKITLPITGALIYTDNGGQLWDSQHDQGGTIRFFPSDTSQAVHVEFLQFSLADRGESRGDYLEVYTHDMPKFQFLDFGEPEYVLQGSPARQELPVILSEADDGSVSFRFIANAPGAEEPSAGWVARITQRPRVNSHALQALSLSVDGSNGLAAEVAAKNLSKVDANAAPVQYKFTVYPTHENEAIGSVTRTIAKIPAEGTSRAKHTIAATIAEPRRIVCAATLAAGDTYTKDNTLYASTAKDRYPIGGSVNHPEKLFFYSVTVGQKEMYGDAETGHPFLERFPWVEYAVDETITQNVNLPFAVAASMNTSSSAIFSDDTDGLLTYTVAIDYNNDGAFSNDETYAKPLAAYDSEARLPIVNVKDKMKLDTPVRMRVGVLPTAGKDAFQNGEAIDYGRVIDFTVIFVDAAPGPEATMASIANVETPKSGIKLTAEEAVRLTIANNGILPLNGEYEVTVLEGKNELLSEKVKLDDLQQYDDIVVELKGKLNLSEKRAHRLTFTLEETINPHRETYEKVVMNGSEPSTTPYAVAINEDKGSYIELPDAVGHITEEENISSFTVEGWFFMERCDSKVLLREKLDKANYSNVTLLYSAYSERAHGSDILALQLGDYIYTTQGDAFIPDQWHHVALTASFKRVYVTTLLVESDVHLYVDGKQCELTRHNMGGVYGSSFHFVLMPETAGSAKHVRLWHSIRSEEEINDGMFKLYNTETDKLIYEFPINEGDGRVIRASAVAADSYGIEFGEIGGEKAEWEEIVRLVTRVNSPTSTGSQRIDNEGKVTLSYRGPINASTTAASLVPAFAGVTFNGNDIQPNYMLSEITGGKEARLEADKFPFGDAPLSQTVTINYNTNAQPNESHLLELAIEKAAGKNEYLADGVSLASPGQDVTLALPFENFDEWSKRKTLEVKLTTQDANAKIEYANKEYTHTAEITLDLTAQPAYVDVVAQDGSKRTYSIRYAEPVGTTPNAISVPNNTLSLTYGDAAVALSTLGITNTGNAPMRFSSSNEKVIAINGEGENAKLYIGGAGEAKISIECAATKEYAAIKLPDAIAVTVARKQLTVRPQTNPIAAGDMPGMLFFEYDGLAEGESDATIRLPEFEIALPNGGLWGKKTTFPLAPGTYDIVPDPDASRNFPSGNYDVTLEDGELVVEDHKEKTGKLTITVTDAASKAGIGNAKITLNETFELTTDGEGKALFYYIVGETDKAYVAIAPFDGYAGADRAVALAQQSQAIAFELSKATCTLTYEAKTGGKVIGATPQTLPEGSVGSEVIALADAGFVFEKWEEDGREEASRADKATSTPQHFTALFKEQRFTLLYTASEGGEITGAATQEGISPNGSGTEVTAKATAPEWAFVAWSDGVGKTKRTDENVRADKTVQAIFMRPMGLPFHEGFDVQNGLPRYWNVASENSAVDWKVIEPYNTELESRAALIYPFETHKLAEFDSKLVTPWLSLEGIADGEIVVRVDVLFDQFEGSPEAKLIYRTTTDGPWVDVDTYTGEPNNMAMNVGEEKRIEVSTLSGARMVQFAWQVSGKNSDFTIHRGGQFIIDNIQIEATSPTATPKADCLFLTDGNGTLRYYPTVGAAPEEKGREFQIQVDAGTEVKVEAVANKDFAFLRWSDGKREAQRIFTATESLSVRAEFTYRPASLVTLLYASEEGGRIVGKQTQMLPIGDRAVAVTAEPVSATYIFMGWSDGETSPTRADVASEALSKEPIVAKFGCAVTFHATANGKDFAGAAITIKSADGSISKSVSTGRDGTAKLEGLAAGKYTYVAKATKHQEATGQFTLPSDATVEIVLTPTTAVESTLLASARVRVNPFASVLQLESVENATLIEVLSISGVVMARRTNDGRARVEIATPKLPAGVYVIRLVDSNGAARSLMAVKEN